MQVSERTNGIVPGASGVQQPPRRKNVRGALVGVLGVLLTTGALLFIIKGESTLFNNAPTISFVAPAEITDAARTLDPGSSAQLAARAKECSVPLAYVVISKAADASGGTIRIRSGSYLSPAFNLADAPQRIAIPFPAPYPTGRGVISVEGEANGAVISISPAWRINSLLGSDRLDVVWNPVNPC
jgi:hypothetical protein